MLFAVLAGAFHFVPMLPLLWRWEFVAREGFAQQARDGARFGFFVEADERDVGAENIDEFVRAEQKHLRENGERRVADVHGQRTETQQRALPHGVLEGHAVDADGDEIRFGLDARHRGNVGLFVKPLQQASAEEKTVVIEVFGADEQSGFAEHFFNISPAFH